MSADTQPHDTERYAAPDERTSAYQSSAGGYQGRRVPGNGMAIASVITGSTGLLITLASYYFFYPIAIGVALATAATVLGLLRRSQAKRGEAPGAGIALIGAILGIAGLLATVGFFVYLFSLLLGPWD